MAGIALAMASLGVVTPDAWATERGLAPTASNITGNGSYSVTSASITGASGFGGGVVYYPTAIERFPVVAISPGYTERWAPFAWIGQRLASWGFVVVGIETNSTLDQPDSRGTQMLRALDWASNSAPAAVRDRVDATRQGVAGHSMGGGGTISAMNQRPSVRAGVPLAPWHTTKSWPGVRNPVMILGGQNDGIAPVSSHAIPLYNGVASGEKAYVELAGAGHNFANSSNAIVSKALVSWFKRFLDDDTRFSPFACGFSGSSISQFRNTCPV
ncbi:alpha/beta hydrolase [Micromonospora sp. NPDC049679]|uniref:alpha/beta hydrolase family protein n=1 Tax=Micromonospora sp. NPDC049679 TaxID=3155920 RepID=UPI0033CFC625